MILQDNVSNVVKIIQWFQILQEFIALHKFAVNKMAIANNIQQLLELVVSAVQEHGFNRIFLQQKV